MRYLTINYTHPGSHSILYLAHQIQGSILWARLLRNRMKNVEITLYRVYEVEATSYTVEEP